MGVIGLNNEPLCLWMAIISLAQLIFLKYNLFYFPTELIDIAWRSSIVCHIGMIDIPAIFSFIDIAFCVGFEM